MTDKEKIDMLYDELKQTMKGMLALHDSVYQTFKPVISPGDRDRMLSNRKSLADHIKFKQEEIESVIGVTEK